MGCDIHAMVEFRRSPEQEHWQFFGTVEFERNYTLFGALAGVRAADIKHVPPRGKAPNPSFQAQFFDDEWHHSHSWLTTDEVRDARTVYEEASRKFPSFTRNRCLDAAIAAMEQLGDARLVFSFDN